MKVYREQLSYTAGLNKAETLNTVKSIGIRRNYALIMNEFSVDPSSIERTRKNIVKCGFLTLFRIPSATEVYIAQMQSYLFSVVYNSESSSRWKMFGVYFTSVPFGLDKCTFIGEI